MADARDYFPKKPKPSLSDLSAAAERCHGCDLYERATQTVFGEGSRGAMLMLVGEQPGDQEDQKGHPFVGPAGALLDRALAEAGISREQTYVTNAVKHFKWTPAPRGKRRIHSKPNQQEIRACRPWLEEEVRAVGPRVLVVMGATAAQSLLGSTFRVTRERGKVLRHTEWAPAVVATVHPSAILRARDDEDRRRQLALLVGDLRVALEAARDEDAPL
jgi:uracil-DNA glycosylase